MPSNYQQNINTTLRDLSTEKTISSALSVCKVLLEYIGIETKSVEDIELSKLKLPNAERYDRWFDQHPHFRGDRACFDITSKDPLLEAKFYALQKRSKLFIAGAVSFTPNFEDRDYTRTDPDMRVGVDFFFTPEKDSVIVVLSNKGKLRLVELSGRLTNTQVEIFNLWHNIAKIKDRNALHLTMWESFKLSSLNKKFYVGMSDSFTSLTQHLQKNGIEEQLANQFANRLHGRLLFLWFLRKKNIINEAKEYFTIGDHNDTAYYANTLSALFFNVLNNENHKDIDPVTPYLNGGLFDQNSDGEYWNTHKPTFPTGFFSTLYDHFNSFNFTTDESTPEYEQIAIDPEMLGRIFESFLATLTTETGAQAKKANGAFYTPREIVSYMSRESLRQYLYTALGSNLFIKKSVDELLDRSDSEWALAGTNSKRDVVAKDDRERIMDALRAVKVLDPAVGSGAFPIGVLHKILSLFERLDPNFDAYETKLAILKDNIYGVDIDPTAIEIARLRAWLSIIVDVEDTRKIKPLPNLDFKFVCANSLIVLEKSEASFSSDKNLKPTLVRIRDEYYATSSKVKKEKLQKEYINLTHKESLFDTEETRQLKSYQPFNTGKSASFYDSGLMHGVDAFDAVIGNPPYVSVKSISTEDKRRFSKLFETGKGRFNLFTLFLEKGQKILKGNGILSYILPEVLYTNTEYKYIRKYLLEKTQILSISNFSSRVFDASVDTSVIVIKNGYAQDSTIKILLDLESMVTTIKQSEINDIILTKNSNDTKIMLDKINYGKEKLLNIIEVQQGIIYSGQKKEDVFSNTKINDSYKKILDGRDIHKYSINYDLKKENRYIKYTRGLHRPREERLFLTDEKLIFPRRSTSFVCTIDTDQFYLLNTAYICLLKNTQYSLKYILGLLNSKVIDFLYSNTYIGWQITIPAVNSMPIPKITQDNKKLVQKIVGLVDQILLAKKSDLKVGTEDLEDQIDALAYKLYGLGDEEIRIIEENI